MDKPFSPIHSSAISQLGNCIDECQDTEEIRALRKEEEDDEKKTRASMLFFFFSFDSALMKKINKHNRKPLKNKATRKNGELSAKEIINRLDTIKKFI